MSWAYAVAAVHALAVVLMLTGALLALRWPRLVLLHAPVAAAILAVNLAGAPCPLTEWELALRERAGAGPYAGGFLGHYAFTPLGLEVAGPGVQAGIYTVALLPNAVGYGLLTARAVRSRGSAGWRRPEPDGSPRSSPPAASGGPRLTRLPSSCSWRPASVPLPLTVGQDTPPSPDRCTAPSGPHAAPVFPRRRPRPR
ncbi:DUF2784 domain-containing protein [Geodermatophilus sabuli]|uniref:DUF2784 domain-containing protein n=1 Tax=Geodermatophilus sabuli TaxID=1564158 RepID=A0A285E9Q5_9ACTN|nr:DUF2784 domain-containing protein [Geodermatophilus sabuli]MBB3085723.1 hypothetical protein [Geodermatophilus sabuli]SNX95858.1 Protein of Unknown function [Geodermatophilus sabuli]